MQYIIALVVAAYVIAYAWPLFLLIAVIAIVYFIVKSANKKASHEKLVNELELLQASIRKKIITIKDESRKDIDVVTLEFEGNRSLHEKKVQQVQTLKNKIENWENEVNEIQKNHPQSTLFGQFIFSSEMIQKKIPAPLSHLSSILLKHDNSNLEDNKNVNINVLAHKILVMNPSGMVKFSFLDPVGLGQNAAVFMRLADHDDTLVTNRAWSEPQHLEQRLAELTEHMENVIQKYLRNEYATIEDYNLKAGEIAEAYRMLVVYDFPVNFSEAAARRLVSIMQNGPRCGVYTLLAMDTSKPLPYGFNAADLEQNAMVIEARGDQWVWKEFDHPDVHFEFAELPLPEEMNKVLDDIGRKAKDASRVEVPFEKISLPKAAWWQGNTSESVMAALGPAGARKVQQLEFGRGTAHHGLIAGRTGSGKSTLLHALITSLVTTYSPDELELYLIDFKEGVEFKRYANVLLPHAKVIAVESEREFGLSVLQGLDRLIAQRGEVFKTADANSLADARVKSEKKIPRVLLLVDEFQVFFAEDDRIASEALTLIDRIVRQGRSFGVHVLFGSQSLAGSASLPRPVMDQMGVRVALQCSEADSRIILAEDNPQARLLSRPGEAIYNDKDGMIEGNNRFQVAFLQDMVQEDMLRQVARLAKEKGYSRVPIIFEGNAPAVFEVKNPLAPSLAGAWGGALRKIPAFVGEPIAIKEATAAYFKRQSGSNLLVVGQDETLSAAMLETAMLSIAAQVSPHLAQFVVLDFTPLENESLSPFEVLKEALPHVIQIGKRRELPNFLAALSTELQRRLDLETETASLPSIFLVIAGLQRARDLRSDDSSGFNFDEPLTESPTQILAKILRDAPEFGIHTLISCDTVANLNRNLDRRSLGELDMRVVLQMSSDDSSNLIDSPAANKLGAHRALFYSPEEGRLEKFRPYRMLNANWVKQLGDFLKRKQAPVHV